jgi:hypothetical protein
MGILKHRRPVLATNIETTNEADITQLQADVAALESTAQDGRR